MSVFSVMYDSAMDIYGPAAAPEGDITRESYEKKAENVPVRLSRKTGLAGSSTDSVIAFEAAAGTAQRTWVLFHEKDAGIALNDIVCVKKDGAEIWGRCAQPVVYANHAETTMEERRTV